MMDIREKLEILRHKLAGMISAAVELCDEGECCESCKYFHSTACTDYLIADHLIANGLTVLPCKVGDAVWGIKKYNRGYAVKQGEVYQMYFGEDMRLCICVKNVCRGEWGANVFATQKEAEQALLTLPKGE